MTQKAPITIDSRSAALFGQVLLLCLAAGARSVITSLWNVPDEATNAKDEAGAPRYTTRDWAGWVLTGEPD